MSTAITASAPIAELAPLTADLLLVRLLPATKRPPALRELRDTLGKFFQHPPTVEEWRELIDALRAEGFLEAKALRLTEAGRNRALGFLGVNPLPPGINWKALQARYLFAKALGLDPTTAD